MSCVTYPQARAERHMLWSVTQMFRTVLGLTVRLATYSFRFSIANLMLFVLGAFLCTMTSVIAYGRIFADSNNELTSTWTILGLFALMFIGAVLGRSVLV
jgi:hypothetical protein